MRPAPSKMRQLARCLLAHETKANKSAKARPAANFGAIEKLRPHLTTLMGNAGFRALLSRSLALAGAEVRWLRAVHVKADGSLDGLELLAKMNPEEIAEGRVALLAQLLGLLVAFIGESLTLQTVREAWPKLPAKDLNFDEGAQQ